MHIKLLRVLQDKEILMLGSNRPTRVDVRIMTATNKNLEDLVEKGRFREDLFYRLNVVTINLPPLRERENDIILLVRHFINKFSKELEKSTLDISDEALEILVDYHWPGNVREVENIIQRLVVMAETDAIEVSDLPSLMRFSARKTQNANRTLAEVETEHIRRVLASTEGNKSQAARILGIDRKTLREKLNKVS